MLDFVRIETKRVDGKVTRTGTVIKEKIEVRPKFVVSSRTKDLMVRGGDFYAIWNEDEHIWSTSEDAAVEQIDKEIDDTVKKIKADNPEVNVVPFYMWDSSSGSIDSWHKYVQKQMRDVYHPLDNNIVFSNTKTLRKDYSSKRLPYELREMPTPAYEELISTLYDPDERDKLEWALGAIISGDSKTIQKFIVLYGDAGSGKSTFLNIVEKLFEGYTSTFNAKELASSSNQFALEAFKKNPLVSIQHDGDLSRIEDNTLLNSIVSHEHMMVNAKFEKKYESKFYTFLFMGTNKPVRITDSRSGIVRRLIDVKPSGNKIKPYKKYKQLTREIDNELGGIAWHCLQKYNELGESYYDAYIPYDMIRMTNDFYDFMQDHYSDFAQKDETDLATVWTMYSNYCDTFNVKNKLPRRAVMTELNNYFTNFKQDGLYDGKHRRNVYSGFKREKFENLGKQQLVAIPKQHPLGELAVRESVFDLAYSDRPAQYADESTGIPKRSWSNVDTCLKDLDTRKLHFVSLDEHHIVIDFDIKDDDGNKSLELNLEAAKRFLSATGLPPTYAETSKSGGGIHLHYIYDGDVSKLSRLYDDNIEVKVFSGKSSLRRMLRKCNDLQIRHINSGLPLKGEKKMVSNSDFKSTKSLIAFIQSCIAKKHHGATKPEIDFIYSKLEEAYNDKSINYDVTVMRPAVLYFAEHSTHNKDYCVALVNKMHFMSENGGEPVEAEDTTIVFYDVEVFPNLFVVCWKKRGSEHIHRLINPKASDIAELLRYRLVGFNNRRYDNHILYARLVGFGEEQLFNLSQKIIAGSKNAMFREAWDLSYTDIYDFCSKKQSLKKWEIELGIHHQELGLRWDQPVPKELWDKVAEYCCNDVIATEKTFEANQADFLAREILADIAGMTVNDTTNTLTTRIIFGKEKHPELVYTDLSEEFPGYEYVNGKNIYRGEDVGKGGYVYAEPGMYVGDIWTFDSASHHPHSILALNAFGEYTDRFKMLLDARIFIKHKDFESAGKLFDGKLSDWLKDPEQAKALSKALKIAINSVYGLTSANFDNPFRDPRNVNNIVALRGALFMVNLRDEVKKRGFKVIHIKTDSIKVLNPTDELKAFINDYAKTYGYEFEVEHKFSKLCLVNDAVFIGKLSDDDPEDPGAWSATGAQFAHPYVYKTLFTKENIVFRDMCETKSVQTALYLDMNENLEEGKHDYHFVGKVGEFCPIKEGKGGGVLLRESSDGTKYSSATGAKGYRWLESETVSILGKEKDIDKSYFQKLVDAAVDTISKYGDFEAFTSDPVLLDITSDELPF